MDDSSNIPGPEVVGSIERRVAVNTGSKYAALLITVGVRILLTPFLIHSLGKMLYGLMTLSNQALQFLTLASSSMTLSYMRFSTAAYARGEYDRMNAVLSSGFLLSLGAGSLFAAGTVLLAFAAGTLFDLPPELITPARFVIVITGASTVFSIVTGVWGSALFTKQRFYVESITSILANLCAAVGVVIAFHVGEPSIIVWAMLSAGARAGARLLYLIPAAKRALPQMRINLMRLAGRAQLRNMMSFGGLNLLGKLGYLLYFATDSILIANLSELRPEQITEYSVAQRWVPLIGGVIAALGTALTPVMTADFAVGNMDRVKETVLRGTRYSVILGLYPCLLLTVFARPFMLVWLGPDFVESSAALMQVIMMGLALSAPGIIGFDALVASGKIGRATAATLMGGVANVGLSILLVKTTNLGLMGLAVGSVTAVCAVNAVIVPYLVCRYTGLTCGPMIRHAYITPMLGALPVLPAALAIRLFWEPANLFVIMLQFALCGVAYAGGVWLFSLTTADRDKIRAAASSLRKKVSGR